MFKKILFFIIIIGFVLTPVLVVNAQYGIDVTAKQTGITSISIPTFLGSILGGVLSMVGIAFFALVLYGGVTWMTAAGNQEKQKKAFGTIVAASIGVVIVLSSYVLVNFVFSGIAGVENKEKVAEKETKGCLAKMGGDINKWCEEKSKGNTTNCGDFKPIQVVDLVCEGVVGGCMSKKQDDKFCEQIKKESDCNTAGEFCKWNIK